MRERRRMRLILGAGLIVVSGVVAACAEAPTSTAASTIPTGRPNATTTDEQPPPDPLIYYASTFVGFYSGEFGDGPQGEILAEIGRAHV